MKLRYEEKAYLRFVFHAFGKNLTSGGGWVVGGGGSLFKAFYSYSPEEQVP